MLILAATSFIFLVIVVWRRSSLIIMLVSLILKLLLSANPRPTLHHRLLHVGMATMLMSVIFLVVITWSTHHPRVMHAWRRLHRWHTHVLHASNHPWLLLWWKTISCFFFSFEFHKELFEIFYFVINMLFPFIMLFPPKRRRMM